MPEAPHIVVVFILIFLVIFVLNVVPVFAPPTWSVLSFIAIRLDSNLVLLAVVAAVAATLGRLVLAKLSRLIIRQKLLSDATRKNIDVVKERLQNRTKLTSGALLFYAFSPFPTNHLFIAYGLTTLKLKLIAIPFLIGRVVVYSFWAFTASSAAQMLEYRSVTSRSIFSYYFIASQLLGLLSIYLFTKIDWRRVVAEKRLRWRRRSTKTDQ